VTTPRVSIVVPCHNGGRFIDGLLASLAAQTFRDFEIIIVNDGSTDPSTLAKLDLLDPSIQVVHQEKRYLPGARNRGISEARSELVLPLDCDDMLEPAYLAETVPLLENAPPDVGFVFTHARLTGALQGVLIRHFNQFDQLFLNDLPYCMLVRRSAWEAAGGYDETMRDGTEDWEFNIRLSCAGLRGIEVPKPLFVYTVRADGMWFSQTSRIYGTIWRRIRARHAELYRLSKLVVLWRAPRAERGKVSALEAICLLGAAQVLPESWFNHLFHRAMLVVRSRRAARGDYTGELVETGMLARLAADPTPAPRDEGEPIRHY
jgi:glycosyltransferase involved in cell wall biosynthesis